MYKRCGMKTFANGMVWNGMGEKNYLKGTVHGEK